MKEANTKYSTTYNKSCGIDCMYWDSIHGDCSIHNTLPSGCKDFYPITAIQKSNILFDGEIGWITDRVPTKEECAKWGKNFLVTVDTLSDELTVLCMTYEYTTVRGKEVNRWVWNDIVNIPWEVIAWRKFPEPYRP